MNDDLAAEGEAVLAAATPGPWHASRPATVAAAHGIVICGHMPSYHPPVSGLTQGDHNAAAIVWLRNHADELLARARRAEAAEREVERLRRNIAHLCPLCSGEESVFCKVCDGTGRWDYSAAKAFRLAEALEAVEAEVARLREALDASLARRLYVEEQARQAEAEVAQLREALEASRIEHPETGDFLRGALTEAAYQRQRRPDDAEKSDADWFWVAGFILGKAVHAGPDDPHALHHLEAAAGLLANWHHHKAAALAASREDQP
jgi:hypothetical protein